MSGVMTMRIRPAATGHETNAYRIRSARISTIPICAAIQHAGLTPIGPKA